MIARQVSARYNTRDRFWIAVMTAAFLCGLAASWHGYQRSLPTHPAHQPYPPRWRFRFAQCCETFTAVASGLLRNSS